MARYDDVRKHRLTNREYAEEHGTICPSCHHPTVEAGRPSVDEGEAKIYRKARCTDCGYRFDEVYNLSGYQER